MQVTFRKSILEPVQELEHLGLVVDFVLGELHLPQHKKKDYHREIAKLLCLSHATPCKVAAILGKIRISLFAGWLLLAMRLRVPHPPP